MKYTLSIIALLFSLLILFSCGKDAIEDSGINDPDVFELLWQDFDRNYALFEAKGIDWDVLYDTYRPQGNSQISNDQLWDVFSNMLKHLNDSRVSLTDQDNQRYFESAAANVDANEVIFQSNPLWDDYLQFYSLPSSDGMIYGKIENRNIGYIRLPEVEGDFPEDIGRLVRVGVDIPPVFILDIRNSKGNSDEYAQRVAATFADGEHFIYSTQTRNGAGHDDFGEKTKWFTQPSEEEQSIKPIILLTNQYTAGSAEILTLHMKAFPQVTIIGDLTAGDHSSSSDARTLPNGWTYHYSTRLYQTPDEGNLEGNGIAPDIAIRNTVMDIERGNDLVLEKAIQYIFDEYGID